MVADNVGKLLETNSVKAFVLGNKAVFTLKNEKTGNRQTYSVYHVKDPNTDLYFVNVRGDGQSIDKTERRKWAKVGMLWDSKKPRSRFVHHSKSEVKKDSIAFKGFAWLWQRLAGNLPLHQDMAIYHEGTCGRCGRQLTDPESIVRGFGPECIKKI